MSTTFLSLVNAVGARLNEVPLNSSNFASAGGIYSQLKEAVNSAITDINSDQFRWPFNYQGENTQALTVGQQFYNYPATARDIDFNTFQLVRDDTLNPPAVNLWLPLINWEEYAQNYRDLDAQMNSSDFSHPRGVVQTPFITQYLITPPPDQIYHVKFDWWSDPAELVLFSDLTTVPDNFTNVITDGAMYYAYMFRDNSEQATIAQKNFDKGLGSMRRVYIKFPDAIRDTRMGPYTRRF